MAFLIDDDGNGGRPGSPIMYYGGKGPLARHIIRFLPYPPQARVYVEPYCGGASVFFWKRPHPVEVLNDINRRLVNLFRVLQDREKAEALQYRLVHTPYARAEFERATEILRDDCASIVDQAWAAMVVGVQGVSGVGLSTTRATTGNWSRRLSSSRSVQNWLRRMVMLPAWHRRLLSAQIDCRDALEVIAYWDTPETVFYVDPPYVRETRLAGSKHLYHHEVDDDHHHRLVDLLLNIRGLALVSGYDHPLYAPLDAGGWHRIEVETAAHAAARTRNSGLQGEGAALAKVPRTEVLWLSPRLATARGIAMEQLTLFAGGEEEDEGDEELDT